MEEDLEIEQLYEAHGQMLMEAAATEQVEDEEEESKVCENSSGEEHKTCVETLPKKRRKWRTKKKLLTRKKYATVQKKTVIIDDASSTDMEELLDNQIVSLVVNSGAKPTQECQDDLYTCIGGNNESENCIDEILEDECVFRERGTELVEQVEITGNSNQERGTELDGQVEITGNSNDKVIQELQSLQLMIDKREDILINIEKKLREELIENENEQRRVREALSLNETSKIKEPNIVKCYFKRFGSPYFHDINSFTPPPNNDTKEKLKNNELVITLVPKLRFWRKSNKDTLQDAIHLSLIEENSTKLVKEIEKLKGMLVNVSEEQEEKEILDKICEHQKKLKRVKSMSYIDLLANEHPEREYDWLKYSASDLNGLFSSEECKRFWNLYLKPTVNKARWEKSEDEKLNELAEAMNFQDWERIAQALNTGRTAYQCLIHYRNRLCDKQDHSVGKWTKEEDEKLMNVINSAKIGDFIPWRKVSTYMGDRTHNQIYNRYVNSLDPKLVKGKFSVEEDLLIVSGIEVFKVNYQEMASLMSNRSANQIRERYERHLLTKTAKTGSFSLEEDEQLLKLVDKYGERNFAQVALEMKTRSRTQIRQRYNWIMQTMRTKPGWTPAQVKRRSVHKISKNLTKTQKTVEKIKAEVEKVEKAFQLTKLESDTFRIEKLKELRDEIFMKKYDITKLKKKACTEKTAINHKLLEFFRVQHSNNPVNSSILKTSVNNVAYLNEIILLAKYFGHDLQLPESAEEIWKNDRLSLNLKDFLVKTLKQRPLNATSYTENAIETSSTIVRESHNIDYEEPEVDNTLIMEECWHNASVDVSSLNFSEFFKRTVFDYSSGMHKDIWDSKISRSKVAMFNYVTDISEPTNDQQYFFPPNSITTLGYKSILLSRNRLKRDANKLPREQVDMKTEHSPTYHLHDKFQETLLSLFYCPKVLSVTDISTTLLPPSKSKASSTLCRTNHEEIVELLNKSNQNISDIVRKDAQPIMEDALREKKMKQSILEHNKTRLRQLKDNKIGLTYNRKMNIEHLVGNMKGRNFSNTQKKTRILRQVKAYNAKCKAEEPKNDSNSLTGETIDEEFETRSPVFNVPVVTYSKTRQSLKRHSSSDHPSEPANKKSDCVNNENTESNQPMSQEVGNSCLNNLSRSAHKKSDSVNNENTEFTQPMSQEVGNLCLDNLSS